MKQFMTLSLAACLVSGVLAIPVPDAGSVSTINGNTSDWKRGENAVDGNTSDWKRSDDSVDGNTSDWKRDNTDGNTSDWKRSENTVDSAL
ncbi:hypothetical protein ASPACDRAFT_79566 [Aspergillus aculeatus ATCC 16872]|uniref:Uncharacterized protein n=1 Tax=Aspergillus aculeatus (strain ATCC 16872 / CBS 172.66 / WB 5094) TaxID=690307 RepID=A0A1L9WRD5_ASPA1|nr:uncharacterized protein ASPACDRAFT_79566 [Aspergillus aculeatus ATCC 16872]OJJ98759.1 hypothetical protein ASPACDRAFT_79566 [Aspergillus aculeatus ATCC 16872]